MRTKFLADPIDGPVILAREVRLELRRESVRDDAERVRLAGRTIESIRQWFKSHSQKLVQGSPEHDKLTDQATYAITIVRKELGVSVKYVKKQHSWIVSSGGETYTAVG